MNFSVYLSVFWFSSCTQLRKVSCGYKASFRKEATKSLNFSLKNYYAQFPCFGSRIVQFASFALHFVIAAF